MNSKFCGNFSVAKVIVALRSQVCIDLAKWMAVTNWTEKKLGVITRTTSRLHSFLLFFFS